MRRVIYSIGLIILILSACRPSKEVRYRFQYTEYCYDGKSNGIDTLIAINGFYEMYKPVTYFGYKKNSFKIDSSKIINDTSRVYIAFYSDGLFTYSINNGINEGSWGKYIIDGSIIKGEYINSPGVYPWINTEIWFQIIDCQTIEEIYFKYEEKITDQEVRDYQEKGIKNGYTSAKFVPLDTLPNPDESWLKKQKWFWCNEDKYEEFMKDTK